jgi:aminopeptidase-like protein
LISPHIRKIVKEELSGEKAKAYVAEITGFHRIQASTMFHQAAEHVRNTLLKNGLENAKIEQFKSDGAKKYWTHTSPMGWEVKSAELTLIEPEQKLLARYADIPTCLHTCSNATPPEGITAELVDVGKGTKQEDYKGKDVKGKLVLASGRAILVHEQAVYKRGAAGVITDTLAYEFPNVRESIDIPDAYSYQGIWPTKKVADKVTFGFSLNKRQGNYLREFLKADKKVKLHARVDAKLFAGYLDVVTATIKGKSKSDEEIFLIAHLCHPQPSANDNASGSGLLIEIAQTIQNLIKSGRIAQPKRTIRFMWVPETYGTIAYLHEHEDWSRKLIAGINLDMVGENQELCKSTLKLDLTPDSLPSYLNDLGLNLMEQTDAEFAFQTDFGSSSTFRYACEAHSGGSDHHEFVDSTISVPCIMLLQWPDKFYHTSMDTIDKVSVDSLKRVGWITTVAALVLANADAEEAYFLANEVYARGTSRILKAEREAVEAVMAVKNGVKQGNSHSEFANQLTRTANKQRYRIEHVADREKVAVQSVKRLGKSSELDAFVDDLVKNLTDVGAQARARFDVVFEFVSKLARVPTRTKLKESSVEVKAKRLKPKRLFKGTLSFEKLRSSLGEEAYSWYQLHFEKDLNLRQKIAEMLNYMDGERTLYEILTKVSAEYTEITCETGLKILQDLEKVGLVVL